MSAGLMPAAEGPAPMYTTPPPDQQPQDLQGALAMVDSIVWRDGGMDPQEQKLLTAWFQSTIMRAQAAAQMAAQGGAPGQSGLGSSGVSDVNLMGGAGSSPVDAFGAEENEIGATGY